MIIQDFIECPITFICSHRFQSTDYGMYGKLKLSVKQQRKLYVHSSFIDDKDFDFFIGKIGKETPVRGKLLYMDM